MIFLSDDHDCQDHVKLSIARYVREKISGYYNDVVSIIILFNLVFTASIQILIHIIVTIITTINVIINMIILVR